jgi:transcription antitermination factor NusG
MVEAIVPLFPRYAFIAFADGQSWAGAWYTPGVASILMHDKHPGLVRTNAIQMLMADDDARCKLEPVGSMWKRGMPCIVEHGAGYKMQGVVQDIRGARADVTVMMLGELRNIDVDVQRLRARDV